MDYSPTYDFPWELITESMTGNLSVEEEIQLQQWLSSDPDHKEKYLEVQELWKNGVEDYNLYRMANEEKAWKSLKAKITNIIPVPSETKVIQGRFIQKPRLLINLVAIAAVFLGLIGIWLWFAHTRNNSLIYETVANEQKKVILSDGSTITLSPYTKIMVSPDYNVSNRTMIMFSGVVYFEVGHKRENPFIVKLGKAQITDIGTRFTIRKGEKEIEVAVTNGKVVFEKLSTKETRELIAGTTIQFNLQNESFGEMKLVKLSVNELGQMLNFENAPLTDVIIALQKVYGKEVILDDIGITGKKITAKLSGMPFNIAMKVICKSLGLEYSKRDSVYILKQSAHEQP